MCFQCENPEQEECCCGGTHGLITIASIFDPGDKKKEPKEKVERTYKVDKGTGHLIGRPTLTAEEMKDPVGSGRRRAERLTPIPEGYLCEWSLLQNAGGGVVPIVGCAGNTATDRHHGPDKSTLNNYVGINLHRICADCHNRWHVMNDPYYDERPANNLDYFPREDYVQHDRITRADPIHVVKHEAWWKKLQPDREAYRAWETKNQEEKSQEESTLKS